MLNRLLWKRLAGSAPAVAITVALLAAACQQAPDASDTAASRATDSGGSPTAAAPDSPTEVSTEAPIEAGTQAGTDAEAGAPANAPDDSSGTSARPSAVRDLEQRLKPTGRTDGSGAEAGASSAAPAGAAVADTSPAAAPKSTPAPSTAAGGITPEAAKKLLADLEQTVRDWADALDKEDRERAAAILADEAFLEKNLNAGSFTILSGTLVPKNRKLIDELLELSRGKDVRVVSWKPGELGLPERGRSIFTRSVPLVPSSLLEVAIGTYRVEVQLRQAVRDGDTWKVMELAVR